MMDKANDRDDSYRVVVWPTGANYIPVGVCREDCVDIRDEILRHVDNIDRVDIFCDSPEEHEFWQKRKSSAPEHYLFYVDLKDVEVDGKHYEILLTIKQKEIST